MGAVRTLKKKKKLGVSGLMPGYPAFGRMAKVVGVSEHDLLTMVFRKAVDDFEFLMDVVPDLKSQLEDALFEADQEGHLLLAGERFDSEALYKYMFATMLLGNLQYGAGGDGE